MHTVFRFVKHNGLRAFEYFVRHFHFGQAIFFVDFFCKKITNGCKADLVFFAGYQVQLATNGDKAAEQLSNSPDEFDLLLTDIRMPGSTSGWDLARRARELNVDLPVIYMTGDSFAAWKREGVSGSRMFQKPVLTQSLINAVAELLD